MNEIIARLARELEEWKQANSPEVFVGPPDRHAQGWIEATSKHRNPILRIKTEAEKRHKMLSESKTNRLEEKLQHDIWDKQFRAIISISDHFYFEGASSSVSRSQLWDVVHGGKEQRPVAVDAQAAPAPVAEKQAMAGGVTPGEPEYPWWKDKSGEEIRDKLREQGVKGDPAIAQKLQTYGITLSEIGRVLRQEGHFDSEDANKKRAQRLLAG